MFSRIHDRSGRCRFRMTLGCSTEQGHTDERSPQRHYGGVVNARDSNLDISSSSRAQVRILLVSVEFAQERSPRPFCLSSYSKLQNDRRVPLSSPRPTSRVVPAPAPPARYANVTSARICAHSLSHIGLRDFSKLKRTSLLDTADGRRS